MLTYRLPPYRGGVRAVTEVIRKDFAPSPALLRQLIFQRARFVPPFAEMVPETSVDLLARCLNFNGGEAGE